MSFFECIYQLIIGPIKLVFEFIFVKAYNLVGNPGFAIVFLSLAMNILVLPLYRRADKMQEDVRNQELSLEPWVSHIKKTFSGDERMMMLSTYYRQRGYKPIYALKGSLSLLLEIPFFLAAYSFLSNLDLLQGVSFGPLKDLGLPDGLISFGGITINLLPVLMTLINVIAAAIYLKGFPTKSKIQMYGIAVIFLVLLYNSPSGLVFYWTLNNLFSLVKNIFYKLKNPVKVLQITLSISGFLLLAVGCLFFANTSKKILFVIVLAFILLQTPILFHWIKKLNIIKKQKKLVIPSAGKNTTIIFSLCCVFLAVLTGLLIPSAVINDATYEFIDEKFYTSPIWFIVSSFLYALGLFVIWMNIFYRLASPKGKTVFCYIIVILSCVSTIDYFFFGLDYGTISSTLVYDLPPTNTITQHLVNVAVVLIISLMVLLFYKKARVIKAISIILCVAALGMSIVNIVGISGKIRTNKDILAKEASDNSPIIPLSKSGKNVVVLMLDRAVGSYFPYLISEKPEIIKQLEGFTYYPNTISFGSNTNIALPAVFGGYDYTPDAINQRDNESLSQKHNESLKIMPQLFSESGFNVTVGNPSYAGYVDEMDLSIYDDILGVNAYKTKGKLDTKLGDIDRIVSDETKQAQFRNFFCYSLFKTTPLLLQQQFYTNGSYFSSHTIDKSISNQTMYGLSKASGLTGVYLDNYSVMINLSDITRIEDNNKNNFTMLCNDLTHSPVLLQTPDYSPSLEVDNTQYDKEHVNRTNSNGDSITFATEEQVTAYHVNMESFLLLGKWFDYLRNNNVYDNTRIIIVSDHGLCTGFEKNKFGQERWKDTAWYNPILLVKDFNSREYLEDSAFMTNADVPSIAFDHLISNPTNPNTGNTIDMNYKNDNTLFNVYHTEKFQITENNGNVFEMTDHAIVTKNNRTIDPQYWSSK